MRVLSLLRRTLVALSALGARIEFALWADSHRYRQHCRRAYLRLMRVNFGRHIYCGPDVYVRSPGNLTLGERCALGFGTRIWNYAPITIGEDFMCAAGLTINTGGHDVHTMTPVLQPIRIGDRCWCGMNVTILAGVTIGNDVVVAAGSIVTKDVPDNCVVAGIPAKVIRTLERDLSRFHRPQWD